MMSSSGMTFATGFYENRSIGSKVISGDMPTVGHKDIMTP